MTQPPDPTAAPAPPPLTERQRAMIELEARWWMEDESRDALVRARFACSPEEYHQQLNELLDHPDALELDPLVVRRLRRQRDRRRRARLGGAGGVERAEGDRGGAKA